MKTVDFSYFIERYNAGDMSDAEKLWFQKELDGNEKLRNEVILRKRTDEILKEQNIISLRNKLADIENRRGIVAKGKKIKSTSYIKYAAVVAGLVLIGTIALYPGKKVSNEEFLDQYYKAYDPPAGQRSYQLVTDDDFTLALEFYNIHDYEKAAILFKKVVARNPKDMQSTLLNGISNFEIEKYPEAKQLFGQVIGHNSNLYIDQAEWYLALCYVKTNENDKAIEKLEKIKKEGGYYSKEAKKALRKLK